MSIPETLQAKSDLFRSHDRVIRESDVLFAEASWLQGMVGQRILPEDYDPLVDQRPVQEVTRYLDDMENVIKKCVAVMPLQKDYIGGNCCAAARV